MRRAIYLGILLAACGSQTDELDTLSETRLELDLYSADDGLALTSDSWVKKVDLVCEGNSVKIIDLSQEEQSVSLFGNYEDCKVKLLEFVAESRVYSYSVSYSDQVGEYEARDETNQLVDKKLAYLEEGLSTSLALTGKCKDKCQEKKLHARFSYSKLNLEEAFIENQIGSSKIYLGIDQEEPPYCSHIQAKMSADKEQQAYLKIDLYECYNTIGGEHLEFALSPKTQDFKEDIIYVQDLFKNSNVSFSKDGDDYSVSIPIDTLRKLWPSQESSSVEILTSNYILAIKNKGGISALVFDMENKCEINKYPKHK